MAMTQRGYWTVGMTFQDDDGATSRMTVNCHETGIEVGYAVIEAYVLGALIPAVQILTDAAFLGFSVSREWYEADRAGNPATAGSDVEDKGVFLLNVEGGFKGSLSIPSIMEEYLISAGAQAGIDIDLLDADVGDFVEAITEDIDTTPLGLAGEVHAVDYRGAEYQSVDQAYKQNRASFKSRNRRG